jgi:hypothetical protein
MPPENNQNFNSPMPQQPQKSGSGLNIILGILLIILVGVVGLWLYKDSFSILKKFGFTSADKIEQPLVNSEIPTQVKSNKQVVPFEGIWDLFLTDVSKKCSYDQDVVSSTVFVSNNKMRSETLSKTTGVIAVDIIDGKYEYLWTSNKEMAIKYPVNDLSKLAQEMKNGIVLRNSDPYAPKSPEFTCYDWKFDETLFVPPTDVEFKTFEEIKSASEIPPPLETDPDKKKMSDLNSFRARAEVFFDMNMNSGYQGFCNSAKEDYISLLAKCRDAQDKYVLYAPLSTGKTYCVDYTGLAGEVQVEPTGLSCN